MYPMILVGQDYIIPPVCLTAAIAHWAVLHPLFFKGGIWALSFIFRSDI